MRYASLAGEEAKVLEDEDQDTVTYAQNGKYPFSIIYRKAKRDQVIVLLAGQTSR